ncbi:S-adenosylmethionine-dependent methyltransferase [Penicillium pulvis]|uniref:S-adenosylmethionine-dependent methyltransferase n=1 Tax=Penicillium pulvis TaxID=1562058 RepID=UPI002548F2EB|nr:S-adenosylmethionine-dependent methyltransferase [Penicillium pulvis]KAJ5802990.1 S-adenosylmethionine-dependent methyltransferase [Penicillium pulvis]
MNMTTTTVQTRQLKVQTKGETPENPSKYIRTPRNYNALQVGIMEFLDMPESKSLLTNIGISVETIQRALPKRFTVYEPLLLLPTNTFNAPPEWSTFYAELPSERRKELYASIAKAFKRLGVTHIAINSFISLTNTQGLENRMRSPSGLVPLYGDFQDPYIIPASSDGNAQPQAKDLQAALWVRTVQNKGIIQIWAPLYTMFSRGNITEKARILGYGPSQGTFQGLDKQSLQQSPADTSVVDMYAGIGYFTFSYLKRGVKRVWGWELNGWSVEGLRRGCEANGWGCKVICIMEDGQTEVPIIDLVESLTESDRVVVFHGDNKFAANILGKIKYIMEQSGTWRPVRHVNLGLLPSSQPSWGIACRVLDPQRRGWLHVHENVDVQEIEKKREEITTQVATLRAQVHLEQKISQEPEINCCHVEHVKTYAPGVMHCVFDISLSGA